MAAATVHAGQQKQLLWGNTCLHTTYSSNADGRLPAVGSIIEVESATYTNSTGARLYVANMVSSAIVQIEIHAQG